LLQPAVNLPANKGRVRGDAHNRISSEAAAVH
jgi:hypothetical protein